MKLAKVEVRFMNAKYFFMPFVNQLNLNKNYKFKPHHIGVKKLKRRHESKF